MEFAVPCRGGAAKCCALFEPCSHPSAMPGVRSQLQEGQILPFSAPFPPEHPLWAHHTPHGPGWGLSPASSEPRGTERRQPRAPDCVLWDVPGRWDGAVRCQESVGPGWCSPWGTGCVLWDHPCRDPAQESPFPVPASELGALRQEQLAWHSPAEPAWSLVSLHTSHPDSLSLVFSAAIWCFCFPSHPDKSGDFRFCIWGYSR